MNTAAKPNPGITAEQIVANLATFDASDVPLPLALATMQLDSKGVLLTPAQVAAMLNVSEKWLAAAREGRKGLAGPPYIKLGNGRTSPIRYPAGSLAEWLNGFALQTSTAMHRTFADFRLFGGLDDRWLFAVNDTARVAVEIFEFLRDSASTGQGASAEWSAVPGRWAYRWITRKQHLAERYFRTNELVAASAFA